MLVSAAEIRRSNDPAEYALGARSVGLGRTTVAVADDIQGVFSNPAVLASVDRVQVGINSFTLFDEYRYLALAMCIPTDVGQIGLSYLTMSVADIPYTKLIAEGTELRVRQDGQYEMGDRVLGLTYAVRGPKNIGGVKYIDFGVTAKFAESYITGDDRSSLTGIGVDAGTRFELLMLKDFRFGVALQNAVQPLFDDPDAGGGSYQPSGYAQNLRLGVMRPFTLYDQQFIGAVDSDNNGAHLGLEYLLDKSFAVRSGFDKNSLTLGLGMKVFSFYGFDYKPYTFSLDYAYHVYPEPLNNLHVFSVSLLGVTKTNRPSIETVLNSSITTTNTLSLEGLADTGSEIQIFVNNRLRKTVKAEDSGVWRTRELYLDEGRNDIYCTAQYEDYVVSDPSNQLRIFSDPILPTIETQIDTKGDTVFITARANKRLKAVVTKVPTGEKVMLAYDENTKAWSGAWKTPLSLSNSFMKLQTMGMDNNDQKTAVIEDYLSTKFVDYPTDKTIITTDGLTVRGKVKSNIKQIVIQGNIVTPDARGFFSVPVKIALIGKNKLTVTAVANNNASVTATMRILRLRQPSDAADSWARKNIDDVMTVAVMPLGNEEDGLFLPKQTITRDDFAKLLVNLRGDLPVQQNQALPQDVAADNEYAPYIQAVLQAGYLSVDSRKGYFNGTSMVLRREALEALVKLDGIPTTNEKIQYFKDVPVYQPYAPYLAAAVRAGMIEPQDLFNPDKEITRAEVAVLISKLKLVKAKVDALYDWRQGYGKEYEETNAAESSVYEGLYTPDGQLVNMDTQGQKLKIVAPGNEALISSENCLVKGIALTGETVTINGFAVPVSGNVFAALVTLMDGKNVIIIDGAGERVIRKVLRVKPFKTFDNTVDNLKYNLIAESAQFDDDVFDGNKPILLSEMNRVIAALLKKQPQPVTGNDHFASWQEALAAVNRFDGRNEQDQGLVQGVTAYSPEYQLSRQQFMDLLMKTENYRRIVTSYTDFSSYTTDYTPKVVSNSLVPAATAVATDEDFNVFLQKYEKDSYQKGQQVKHTGEAAAGGAEVFFEVTSPHNAFVTTASSILVTGTSRGSGTLKINGKPIGLGQNGLFNQEITLNKGKNEIDLETDNDDYILYGTQLITYKDIAGLPESRIIEYLATAGYFKEGETFNPNEAISREEYAALLVRVSHEAPPMPFKDPYPDVAKDRWSAPSIQYLLDKGVISSGASFGPEATIIQEDAAGWYSRITGFTPGEIAPTKSLRRIDVVRWLVKDKRVQQDLLKLREF
jgi:hypothetical protein